MSETTTPTTTPTRQRRTHEQALAHRKYRRMKFMGGDGEWLTLSRCTDPWSYRLYGDMLEAMVAVGKPCGPGCKGAGAHKCWRVLEPAAKQ